MRSRPKRGVEAAAGSERGTGATRARRLLSGAARRVSVVRRRVRHVTVWCAAARKARESVVCGGACAARLGACGRSGRAHSLASLLRRAAAHSGGASVGRRRRDVQRLI
eukprot:945515-Prymnesium_polylepis.1